MRCAFVLLLLVLPCSAENERCAMWCNSWTCGWSGCSHCSVCPVLEAGKLCSSWCNRYTWSQEHCHGCSSHDGGHHQSSAEDLFTYGHGVCRTSEGGAGVYTVLRPEPPADVDLKAACAEACATDPGCFGFEYQLHPWTEAQAAYLESVYVRGGNLAGLPMNFRKCELHTGEIGYAQADLLKGSIDLGMNNACAIRKPTTGKASSDEGFDYTLLAAPAWGVLERYGLAKYSTNVGACRTADGGGGDVTFNGPLSPKDCQAKCDADSKCVAFEILAPSDETQAKLLAVGYTAEERGGFDLTCEIHAAPIQYTQTSGITVNGVDYTDTFQCYVKVI